MKESGAKWAVRDEFGLLAAIVKKLAGCDGHVSFEGSLRVFNLSGLPEASGDETNALKRNTIWPKQDFLVFSLEPVIIESVFHRLGRTLPRRILHTQIEKNGILEFAAYDNFHPECMFFGPTFSGPFLDSLVSEGILSSVTRARK